MSSSGFAYTHLFSKQLPPPAQRWAGFPKYNFIGGHNDPEQIPVEALAEAAAAVLRREGPTLAMYNLSHGPQGFPGIRDFVADKVSSRRGIACSRDGVLITSGSGQGLDIVSRLFVNAGDRVILRSSVMPARSGGSRRSAPIWSVFRSTRTACR